MRKIINGKEIEVDVLGGFTINELMKKYVVCSYQDDDSNFIMVYETDDNDNLVSVKDEEKEQVLEAYKAFKNDILNEGDEANE